MKMNKTIWTCWFQGEDDSSIPALNQECIKKWRDLNPDWQVNVLSNKTIANYVPEYFGILKKSKFKRNFPAKSDLLRLLLLNKYGGVWVDASVYPMDPLDSFLTSILNSSNFFTYRFKKRNHRRETVSWFLAVKHKNHYLITTWLDHFIRDFINGPKDWNMGQTPPFNPTKFYEVHATLSNLYDSNEKIKNIIDNMVQIDQAIPHSACKSFKNKIDSYMYKRPNLGLDK